MTDQTDIQLLEKLLDELCEDDSNIVLYICWSIRYMHFAFDDILFFEHLFSKKILIGYWNGNISVATRKRLFLPGSKLVTKYPYFLFWIACL